VGGSPQIVVGSVNNLESGGAPSPFQQLILEKIGRLETLGKNGQYPSTIGEVIEAVEGTDWAPSTKRARIFEFRQALRLRSGDEEALFRAYLRTVDSVRVQRYSVHEAQEMVAHCVSLLRLATIRFGRERPDFPYLAAALFGFRSTSEGISLGYCERTNSWKVQLMLHKCSKKVGDVVVSLPWNYVSRVMYAHIPLYAQQYLRVIAGSRNLDLFHPLKIPHHQREMEIFFKGRLKWPRIMTAAAMNKFGGPEAVANAMGHASLRTQKSYLSVPPGCFGLLLDT
jgi:hypothetical protein